VAPLPHAVPRLRHSQVRRSLAAKGLGRTAIGPAAVRAYPGFLAAPPDDDRSAHGADRRILRPRFQRAVYPRRYRAVSAARRGGTRVGARVAGSVHQTRFDHHAARPQRSALRGTGDSRGSGDRRADPRIDARADARYAAVGMVLEAADGDGAATGPDERVRARAAVAARRVGLPVPGWGGLHHLVPPQVFREIGAGFAADVDGADSP